MKENPLQLQVFFFLFLEKNKETKKIQAGNDNSPFPASFLDGYFVLLWLQLVFFMPILLCRLHSSILLDH